VRQIAHNPGRWDRRLLEGGGTLLARWETLPEMSVYAPLADHLREAQGSTVTFSFDQIEGIIERPLPPSAHNYDRWWGDTNSRRIAEGCGPSPPRAGGLVGKAVEGSRLRVPGIGMRCGTPDEQPRAIEEAA
jgi:hypothetical protein